jgi:hypothetical protein
MVSKEEKQKLVDILSGKDLKWKVRARRDFQNSSDSIDNFVFTEGWDGLDGDLFVEYIILAKDKNEAYKRAEKVFYEEFNQPFEYVTIVEWDGD